MFTAKTQLAKSNRGEKLVNVDDMSMYLHASITKEGLRQEVPKQNRKEAERDSMWLSAQQTGRK